MDAFASSLKAILGPTNTGKTYFAIERLLAHRSGMIGLPLRLLAREVYTRIVERVGVQAVALVTGEERIAPVTARYWVATVEAMPLDLPVDCLVVDEIQTATDLDRGHVFTNRLLHARGMHETLLLGSATMTPAVRQLLPHAEIIHRPRLSQLFYAGSKKMSRQPERSAIVAFSASQVYAIAELIRRERGGAAVVMGALSPRTRNAQVELYQSGEVDFLVATDAIGMGLNLDIRHVAFADDTKFDGRMTRPLTPSEFGQIAGRAGRHTRDGTFGVTGGTEGFDEDLVQRLESHDFDPVSVLQWRNPELDFSRLEALKASLDLPPRARTLTRVPTATDQRALEFLMRNEAAPMATSEAAVRLLWDCCQIPDYRDISPAAHGEIVTRIFTDIIRKGRIDPHWIAEQVRFCDNASGDIDTLANRLKQVRTWTFIANRKNWLADPGLWREKTRDIEDRLSDALHERLVQRFVDRRTSVLFRHLRDKRMVSPEINERGEVSLEGHAIGTLEGFRFTLARIEGEADARNLRSAADQVVAPELKRRAERLAGAPNEELLLATDGRLRWRGEVVAELAEGDALLRPRILLLADESLNGPDLDRVQDRLNLWLRHHINTQLEQVIALAEPPEIEGAARGLAFRLSENLGILPRQDVSDDVKTLDQDVRAKLRKLGIKFGAYHIYLPQSLKPAPRELALILFALKNGGIRQPGVSELPHIVLSGRTSFVIDPLVDSRLYEVAGFKVAGKRAVRVDILERLADIIRPLIAFDPKRSEVHPSGLPAPAGAAEGNGFRVTVEMTSLLGCSGEDFSSILSSLGYRMRRVPKPVEAASPPVSADDSMATSGTAPGEAELPLAAPDDQFQAIGEAAPAHDTTPPDGEEDRPETSDRAALEAVEGNKGHDEVHALGDPEEAVALAEATGDLGGPPVETVFIAETRDKPAQTTEAATPEASPEPQFDEVWYPGGRRPDNRRSGPRREDPSRGGEAEGDAVSRPPRRFGPRRNGGETRPPHENPQPEAGEAERVPQGKRAEPARKGFEKKRFEPRRDEQQPQGEKRDFAPRPPRGNKPEQRPQREKREPAFDPDSPFAALAALRNRKPE